MKFFKIILLMIFITFSNNYSQVFWENTPSLETEWIWSLAINSNGYIFAGTKNHGLFCSTDNGTNWSSVGSPAMLTQPIWSILIDSGDEIYVPTLGNGVNSGVFHSIDNGASWNSIGAFHCDKCIAKTNSNQWLYCGTDAFGMFRTKDEGLDGWAKINNGMTATSINVLFVDSNEYLFAGATSNSDSVGSGGVYRSTDYGEHWVQRNSGLTNLQVYALLKANGFIFAGTEGGGVFRSANDGGSWIQTIQGLTNANVYSLATNSVGEIFAGTDAGIYRSVNNGGNWVQINTGLTNLYVKSIAIAPNGFGFTGTESGIFRSNSALPVELSSFTAVIIGSSVKLDWRTDTEVNNYGFDVQRKSNNGQWEKVGFVNGNGNSNSPKDYSYVDLNPVGGSEFLYRLKQIDNDGQFEYSDIVEAELVPTEFALYQNFPNPFNPTTKIIYSVPNVTLSLSSRAESMDEGSRVQLKIFDVLGNEIATLVDEYKPAGMYEIEWSAVNIPSGVYFYRLQAGSFAETRKMSLLK